jgi:Cof subfamily protein (haloacid dehalogenase superfamily)
LSFREEIPGPIEFTSFKSQGGGPDLCPDRLKSHPKNQKKEEKRLLTAHKRRKSGEKWGGSFGFQFYCGMDFSRDGCDRYAKNDIGIDLFHNTLDLRPLLVNHFTSIMYKAVFLDMDGTLLRTDHSVSDATKQTILNLTARGIPVILVSARPLDAILPTAKEIGLSEKILISLNGSYITEGGRPLFEASIDLDTTARLAEQIRPFGATVAYYLQREWFAEVNDTWTEHEQKIMDVKIQVHPLAELLQLWSRRGDGSGPNKMMVMSEPDIIARVQGQLTSIYNGKLNIYPSKPTYLEIMDPRASKANAVRLLIEKMQIARSEVIAMGDNFNDREMIEFVGMGVAMGNAPEEIRKIADYVTDTNNEDGVRKALEKLLPI